MTQKSFTLEELATPETKEGQSFTLKELMSPQLLPNGRETPAALDLVRRMPAQPQPSVSQPESTMLTRGRELLLGGAEGLGIPTRSTIPSQASATLQSIYGIVPGLARAAGHPIRTLGAMGQDLIEGPSQAYRGAQAGDYDAMARGVGKMITMNLPALYGAGKIAAKTTQAVRVGISGGKTGFIEQMIQPKNREAQAVAAQISKDLAADKGLVGISSQPVFDKAVFSKFKEAERLLNAAESTIPAGTTISRDRILFGIDDAIRELEVAGESMARQVPIITPGKGVTGFRTERVPQTISGHPDALKILKESRQVIAKFPENIPFEDLRQYRQQLDKSIQTHSGWKETATAADQAAMIAKRQVANVIRGELRGVSPAMDAANRAYSLAADTMAASGLDWNTGRRLSTIGKPTAAQRIVKAAGAGAAGAAGAGVVYGLYKEAQSK